MGLRVLGGNMLRPDILMLLVLFSLVSSAAASVTYDHRAIMINGQRRILISGSIHYPRSTPEVLYVMPMSFTGSFFFCLLLLQIPHNFFTDGCLWFCMF